MLKKIEQLSALIGNTPIKRLNFSKGNLYVKLEYNNFSGSIKDRAANRILQEGIKEGKINRATKIIESSSGNFAISLAYFCRQLGLQFIPVIDPNINSGYERLLRLLVPNVVKVNKIDETGGYLLTRLSTVNEICSQKENIFWTNQYDNVNNYKAYLQLGDEVSRDMKRLDYCFIGVSSGGTITGLSQALKNYFPSVKIIAVDVEGSVIFDQLPRKRHVSGIGSSKKPTILQNAIIDDVVHVSEPEIISACHDLLNEQTIFGGASTGASYAAVKKYFDRCEPVGESNILFLCPDKGSSYIDTIYNDKWAKDIFINYHSENVDNTLANK